MFKSTLTRTCSFLRSHVSRRITSVYSHACLSTVNHCIDNQSVSPSIKSFKLYTIPCNHLSTTSKSFSEAETEENLEKPQTNDPKDRRGVIISPETSIKYLKSAAYKETYGDEPVWVKFRRNFKGQFVPRKSRKTCIRGGFIATGNPCPICRDEYLVLDYTNVDLLKQFLHPQTGKILESRKTHICQKRMLQLEVAIIKAKFHGLLTHKVPFRFYNYDEYYPNLKKE